ncbi:DHA2 family efflux MFS transporter permease subunit [Actinoallomurus iriomotensis]|uniref:MFS transporter n=1 Tax=Actinoallomurus iriomotensis TaxID=478107 RepID=A0A9W6RDE4_9ACTN|nr:DHA2 family efflux MFS transporter permease subunit [Actinoallomurus iriomotensis]GLY72645.1 MFS transporter [Actinoallomurus iriomotensis]
MTARSGRPAETGLDPELRRLAVVVVLGAIMTILDSTIVNVAVNTLGRDFHTSLATIQWVLTAYTLALAVTIPVTGWAVRRFGGRTMWIASLVLFITGSVLCGAAWSVGSLIAFRVVQAVGGGMLMPVGQTMLAAKAGPRRMGRVMSVVAVPAMLGPVVGPVLGGILVDDLAWRWMFFINVPVCAVALAAAFAWLPPDTERVRDARLDVLGLVLLSPGLAALVYGLAQAGGGHGVSDPRVYGWVAAGAALIAVFAAHALRRRERALVDLGLFRDRAFTTSVTAMFVYVAAVFGVMFTSPVFFQAVRGDTPLRAGLLLAPMGIGAMIMMPVAGRLTDRAGSRLPALAGLVLVLAGLAFFTRLDAHTGTLAPALAIFVVGLGQGTMMPSLMAAAYQRLDRAAVPAATAASNIVVRVGSSFGVAALAVALQIYLRRGFPATGGSVASAAAVRTPDALTRLAHTFAHGFWWALAIAAVALVPIALIPGRPRDGLSVVEGDGAVAEPLDDRV